MVHGQTLAWSRFLSLPLSLTWSLTLSGLSHVLPALDVGEPCPSLIGVSWLSEPAPHTGAHLTLLTLWTPDDPVYRSIMPRMTDLQHRHPEVLVVGVSAADQGRVERVLEAMSGRVGYANGILTRLDPFMPPAGLPCSLLVDAHGTVLWWGHPLDAAEPLAEALQGTLHVEAGPVVEHAAPEDAAGVSASVQSTQPAQPVAPAPEREETRVVVEPARQVVVVEPEHSWWAWRAWPVPVVPLCVPIRPFIVAPPLPPPLWHGWHFRR
jgi:hypothetical protein